MAHAIWKGNISFGLITIPVSVVSAENKTEALDFDLIDRRDHAHVGYQKINKKTGKVIDNEDIVKGLKLDTGKYAIFDQEELKKFRIKGTSTIDLQHFVSRGDVDPIYFKKFYYLTPASKVGEKTYVLLRETLLKTAKFAAGLIVIHNRQQLVLVGATEEALILHMLQFASEIKSTSKIEIPKPGLKSVKLNPKEISMAEKLVEELTDKWNPQEFKDTYIKQVKAAVSKKGRKKITADDDVATEVSTGDEALSKVLDLMPLLEKSLKKKSKTKSRSRRAVNQ